MNTSPTDASKSPRKSSTATRLMPIALLMTIFSGCATYKVIDAEKAVTPLQKNEVFTAPRDGWFVPDARWKEMREAIAGKIHALETGK